MNGPRVLTEAQRQRKRERDRATKREEKAKNQQRLQELEQTKEYAAKRIKELEDEVEFLSKSCTCNRGGNSLGAGSSSLGIGSGLGQSHSLSSSCRSSSIVSYASSSNLGITIFTRHQIWTLLTHSHLDTSETGSADSPIYDYPQDARSEYGDTSYTAQENFSMYYGNNAAQVSPVPYRIQTTVPQVNYSGAAMTPTTWSTTLHPITAIAPHTYSPHPPHAILHDQEPKRVSLW